MAIAASQAWVGVCRHPFAYSGKAEVQGWMHLIDAGRLDERLLRPLRLRRERLRCDA
jgi:hypothetical protein